MKDKPILANRFLCFLISGLSTKYRLPVAFFFTKKLSGKQLHELTKYVLKEVKDCGFFVLRLVTDNHKSNVTMMKFSSGQLLKYQIPHPTDSNRSLFLAFDQCHILKNLRSQLLERTAFDGDENITGMYIKKLYEIQSSETMKLVPFLSRKHVLPSNLEKMNVKRAKEIFFS